MQSIWETCIWLDDWATFEYMPLRYQKNIPKKRSRDVCDNYLNTAREKGDAAIGFGKSQNKPATRDNRRIVPGRVTRIQ